MHTQNRTIHDAGSDDRQWQLPPGFEVVSLPGEAEMFAWPNGHPARCLLDPSGIVAPNPAWAPAPDIKAAARLRAWAEDPTNPPVTRGVILDVLRVLRRTAMDLR